MDPNGAVPPNDRQPIFWAAYSFDEEMFNLLLEYGAELEAHVEGKTALEHALRPYNNVADFLRAHGATEKREAEESRTTSEKSNDANAQ